jgi:hypothetical protein
MARTFIVPSTPPAATRAMGPGMNAANLRHHLKLVSFIAAVVLTACGDEVLGSGNRGDSGSTDASVYDSGTRTLDSGHASDSTSEASVHDGGSTESGPPNTGDVDCVLSTYGCTDGLPSPCWWCPGLGPLYENCKQPLPDTCNEMTGFGQCLTCRHGLTTEYQCEGTPPHWKALAQADPLTCSE